MKRFSLRRGVRTIRARVLAIVLIPCLTLLALGIGGATYLVKQGTAAQRYADKIHEVIEPSITFLNTLNKERRVTMLAMAGDQRAIAQLADTRAVLDQLVLGIGDMANTIMEVNPAGMAKVMPVLAQFFAQLPEMRQRVDANQATLIEVSDSFSSVINTFALAMAELARTSPESSAAVDIDRVADIAIAADEMEAANSIGIAAVTGGGLSFDEWRAFRRHVEAYHVMLQTLQIRLPEVVQTDYHALTESDAWKTVSAAENAVIDRGPRPSPTARDTRTIPITLDQWQQAADTVGGALMNLWGTQDAYAHNFVAESGKRTFTNSLWAGGGVVVLTLLALIIAIRMSNKLVRRLKRLRRETLDLAEEKLPVLVQQLRGGKQVSLETEGSKLDFGNDEVGEVADAFNKAYQTATAAAVQEAKTREGVNAVFLNIAHRSQVVVHRQLEVLDQAERREEDPDQLELLFKLDHLATRTRRNAENLIILGGQQPGRQWRNPVPLVEIVRSAVAETEDYARVRTGRLPAVSMVGAVVADLVHLLAELVDNATSFSPPESRVEVRGNVVGTGIVVEVEDQGLGITKAERDRLNESLHNPPEFEVMSLSNDARLGLFVVARLAARHGISVTLAESAYGGTRAIVLIRQNLIAPVDDNKDDTETDAEVTDIAALRTPRQRQPHADTVRLGAGVSGDRRRGNGMGNGSTGKGVEKSADNAVGNGASNGASSGARNGPSNGAHNGPGNGPGNGRRNRPGPGNRTGSGRGASAGGTGGNGGAHERSVFEPASRKPAVNWPSEEIDAPSPRPRHAQPTVVPADNRPPLPKRRRQANLAPQLATETNVLPASEDRPPEKARDTMAAFQRGTRQARDGE